MNLNSSFKQKIAVLIVAGTMAVGVVQPAHAIFGVGDIVLDPSNLVQNIMTAARALEQINNQIRQLQNEAQMLTNQAKNLTGLNFSALNELRSALSATNQLLQIGRAHV